jgi:hypothetical protein
VLAERFDLAVRRALALSLAFLAAPSGASAQPEPPPQELRAHSLLASRWHDITHPEELAAGLDRVERLLAGEVSATRPRSASSPRTATSSGRACSSR